MKKWIVTITTLGLALFFLYFNPPRAAAFSKKTPPANIVFILADDLNEDIFYKDEKLPSLLLKNGAQFTNYFAPLPLCCPSRVSTLRGQFAHNTTIYTNLKASDGGFEGTFSKGLESSTIAVWLKNAGYQTALIGKYLNGYPKDAPNENYVPPGWSYFVSPNAGYFQSQYNYSLNENGVTIKYGDQPEDYLSDVLADKSIGFIKDCKKNHPDKPFFLYIASHAPHKPATPPARYVGRYDGEKAPRHPSFDEEDVSDKPEWVQNKKRLNERQLHDIDELYALRRASLLGLADLTERVIKTLEQEGLMENTYVFFTSDNGFHQGEHRLNSGKSTAYEEDIKLPLVVLGPGIKKGVTIPALTANVDYAPTFADIASIKIPDFVDGRSFLPFLKGEKPKTWRQVLLLEFGGPVSITPPSDDPLLEVQDPFDIDLLDNAKYTIPAYVGLRFVENPIQNAGPMTFIKYETNEKELYFLDKDPRQLDNTYNDVASSTKEGLNHLVDQLKDASGQALRTIEETPPIWQ